MSQVAKKGWKVTRVALDGDVVEGIPRQLDKTPQNTTHIVLSVGGNNGLHLLSKLEALGYFSVFSVLSEATNFFRTSNNRGQRRQIN
jgi:hypothetical protein